MKVASYRDSNVTWDWDYWLPVFYFAAFVAGLNGFLKTHFKWQPLSRLLLVIENSPDIDSSKRQDNFEEALVWTKCR